MAAATDWFDQFPTVRSGTWLYDGTVPCRIRIVRSPVFHGSGDEDDPPELREDREVESFYVLFSPPSGPGGDMAYGPFLTLAAAASHGESLVGDTVRWD